MPTPAPIAISLLLDGGPSVRFLVEVATTKDGVDGGLSVRFVVEVVTTGDVVDWGLSVRFVVGIVPAGDGIDGESIAEESARLDVNGVSPLTIPEGDLLVLPVLLDTGLVVDCVAIDAATSL